MSGQKFCRANIWVVTGHLPWFDLSLAPCHSLVWLNASSVGKSVYKYCGNPVSLCVPPIYPVAS